MRICFFTSANSLQGGAEKCQVLIARHQMELGDEVHVVLPGESELTAHYRALGASVHVRRWEHLRTLRDPAHVARYAAGLPVITGRLADLLRARRIDLMHVNEILDFQGLIAARMVGVPSVAFARVILPSPPIRQALAALVTTLADQVVCVSEAVRRLAFGGTNRPKVRVIYDGGPDLEIFDPRRVQPIRPPGARGARVIGMVSKLVREKGHMALLNLAVSLRRRGVRDVHYVIVGGEVPGHEDYAEEVRRRIEREGLSDVVHLVGQRSNVAGYLAGMDLLCHVPLWEDPFPGVPMEAAVMERAVIGFLSGGVPEELTHPTTARLVPIGDVESLADHAVELLDDEELRARMGRAARREVLSKVSLPKHFTEIDALYAELAERSGRPQGRARGEEPLSRDGEHGGR